MKRENTKKKKKQNKVQFELHNAFANVADGLSEKKKK